MPDQIKLKVNQNNEDRFRAASEAAGADWSKRNDFFTTLALQAVEQGLHLPNDEASAILESEVASGSNLADDHAETRAVVAGYFKQFFQQLNEKRDAVAVHLASQIADRISQSGQSTSEEITAAEDRLTFRINGIDQCVAEKVSSAENRISIRLKEFVHESQWLFDVGCFRQLRRRGVGIAMVGLFAELITFFTSSSIGLPGRLGIWLMIILAIDISLTQLPSRVTLDNEDALNQQNIGL